MVRARVTTPLRQSGRYNFAGTEEERHKTHEKIIRDELRLWLLKSLLERDLATREIYYFVKKQGDKRETNKKPDIMTIRSAMSVKIKDLLRSLKRSRLKRSICKKRLLEDLDHKSYRLRKRWRAITNSLRPLGEKIKEKYEKKILHYTRVQKLTTDTGLIRNNKRVTPTPVPKHLQKYETLSIFRLPEDLPVPLTPLGPFVCDPKITLTREEKLILSKDPKFSIAPEPSEQNFRTEEERMIAKHRYNSTNYKRKKEGVTAIRLDEPEKEMIQTDRLTKLHELYLENKNRFTYNPTERSISFQKRRATEYKLNKSVKLPKPLNSDQEFECEVRRREFLQSFYEYTNIQEKRKRKGRKERGKAVDNKKMKGTQREIKRTQSVTGKNKNKKKDEYINLSRYEIVGMESLKKRIKAGEIIITATDKSSRFAILNKDQ